MRLFTFFCAVLMGLSLQAHEAKEFTYDWLVEQFTAHQFNDVASIKKHLSFYTQLVQDDVYDCQQRLAHSSGRIIQFLAGMGCIGTSCLSLPKILGSWPRLIIKDGHFYRDGGYVFSNYHFTNAVLAFAAGIFGLGLIKKSIQELTDLQKRIELNKEIIADLYALSITT